MIDGKWFFIHDGIISGRSCQLYNGEEHDIDILIFMVVGSDQFQKLFVDFPIGVFSVSRAERRAPMTRFLEIKFNKGLSSLRLLIR